ncbi:MAG: sodium:proton antiporter NhaD [Gammaproteobacteria bacterium]|nr:sodium:proton antiporter NhaD [Gammaproteobacteria bacterium]
MQALLTCLLACMALLPVPAFAMGSGTTLDLTGHWAGYLGIAIFVVAYLIVMAEEYTDLRKSKPVIIAAGAMWAIIAWVYRDHGMDGAAGQAIRHNLLEYAELMLFLLVAMTYVNAMQELNVFAALRSRLVKSGFGFRALFWITGLLAFVISPIADNLTTALLMCAVVMAVGGGNPRFVLLSCINIVVAANAGGAFSPFGDITTLMVWQKGIVQFGEFFALFLPALVNFAVPAALMHFAIPNEKPAAVEQVTCVDRGGRRIILLFLLTIVTAVSFHSVLHLPPVIGMLTGMGYLGLFGFYLKKTPGRATPRPHCQNHGNDGEIGDMVPFDVFRPVARAEWDTLFFFYGVVACVGALGFMGYLALSSELMYAQWGPTPANITVGVLSAIVDNIPIMFAVLSMEPDMSLGQWLLVTLTAGVGGSLLSIGSAAGVALMGQARGAYTFFGHLKWSWAIALGYAASIATHFWLNSHLF